MRLVVISIGRLKQGPERELSERYRERFDDIGRKLGFRGLDIHEIPESRARDAATRMAEEAAAISAAIPAKSALVALDERGDNIDSATFARFAAQGKACGCVRRGDLAAPDGSCPASGTDLPGRDHFGRSSLSSRVSRAEPFERAPTDLDAAAAEHSFLP